MKATPFAIALTVVLPALSLTASAAIVYDLTNDWSNAVNPNGPWSYTANGSPIASTNSINSDPWSTPQPGWSTGSLPLWFRSNGTEQFTHDWISGDVVTHTPFTNSGYSSAKWTSPEAGLATISGAIWPTREIGRFNVWGVYKNGTLLTDGEIGSGDPYSRANPFDLSTGSGGSSVLDSIPIAPGDVIELRVAAKSGSTEDYAAMRFTITTVPEPSSAILSAGGLLGLLTHRRRREH